MKLSRHADRHTHTFSSRLHVLTSRWTRFKESTRRIVDITSTPTSLPSPTSPNWIDLPQVSDGGNDRLCRGSKIILFTPDALKTTQRIKQQKAGHRHAYYILVTNFSKQKYNANHCGRNIFLVLFYQIDWWTILKSSWNKIRFRINI